MFSFILVLGNILFPTWLFQGMEKMRYITIINVITKIIFIIPVFLFIKDQSSYVLVPLINSLSFLVAGIFGFYFAVKTFKIKLFFPTVDKIIYQLKDGWHVFISTLAISLYTTSNIFILGIFTNNMVVGYYSAAEKIIKAVQGLIEPISQTVYPRISKLFLESREKAISFLKKLILIIGPCILLLSLGLFLLTDKIALLILGPEFINSILIIKILAFVPFIVFLSNVFGIQTLLTFNFKKEFSRILVITSIMSIFLSIILVNLYQEVGIALNVLITESIITIWMFIELKRKKIKLII